MAAEEARANEEGDLEVTLFGCKCPIGSCPKQGKWLGVKGIWYTERRARQAVYDHLASTGAHSSMSVDNCADEAEVAEIVEWKISETDENLLEDMDKNNCSLADLQEWQNSVVFFDDAEKRAGTKRNLAEPSGVPPRKKQARQQPRQLNRPDSEARPRRRSRSRSRRSRDRRSSGAQPATRALQQTSQPSRHAGSSRDTHLARSDRVQLANLGDRLENQISEQTRNAYIFVQVYFS